MDCTGVPNNKFTNKKTHMESIISNNNNITLNIMI